jgi:hypothetical protein
MRIATFGRVPRISGNGSVPRRRSLMLFIFTRVSLNHGEFLKGLCPFSSTRMTDKAKVF